MFNLNLFHAMFAIDVVLHLIAYAIMTTQPPTDYNWALSFVAVLLAMMIGARGAH